MTSVDSISALTASSLFSSGSGSGSGSGSSRDSLATTLLDCSEVERQAMIWEAVDKGEISARMATKIISHFSSVRKLLPSSKLPTSRDSTNYALEHSIVCARKNNLTSKMQRCLHSHLRSKPSAQSYDFRGRAKPNPKRHEEYLLLYSEKSRDYSPFKENMYDISDKPLTASYRSEKASRQMTFCRKKWLASQRSAIMELPLLVIRDTPSSSATSSVKDFGLRNEMGTNEEKRNLTSSGADGSLKIWRGNGINEGEGEEEKSEKRIKQDPEPKFAEGSTDLLPKIIQPLTDSSRLSITPPPPRSMHTLGVVRSKAKAPN